MQSVRRHMGRIAPACEDSGVITEAEAEKLLGVLCINLQRTDGVAWRAYNPVFIAVPSGQSTFCASACDGHNWITFEAYDSPQWFIWMKESIQFQAGCGNCSGV